MVLKEDYQMAIWSQSAVNIKGLVKDLVEILGRIWEEAIKEGKGTDYVNSHPIVRLFAEQIYYLASKTDYHEAYKKCKEKIGEEVK